MGDKMPTIILKVDLECCKCYKKISKTICKLQERESIQTINFDKKNNAVMISGLFDPKKLSKKLCCKACKVIKDIQIKAQEKEKEKTKEKEKEKEKTKEKEKEKENTKEKEKEKEKTKEKEKEKENTKEKEKEKEKENAKEKEKLKHSGGPGPGPGPWCTCGCRPGNGVYYGDYKCPWCGRGYGWLPECPPPVIYVAPPPYPCGGYKTCTYICEDPQPSCSIM